MSFLDIDDEEMLPVSTRAPTEISERLRDYDKAFERLSINQKKFLTAWPEFNYNQSRTCRHLGMSPSTVYRWGNDEDYALVVSVMRGEIAKEILDKNRLAIVQEECVQSLMTEKPVLHGGIPVLHDGKILMEIEAAAAAKVVESQLRLGGHLNENQEKSGFTLPQLVVQVTNRVGGEVEQTIVVGVAPPVPPLLPDWLDDGT